jgi:hypothetical protein
MSFRPSYTDVEICNKALDRLAQSPITSLDPPTPNGTGARSCAIHYKDTVAKLLALHHWNLATKRATLADVTNARDAEWLYAYQKPTDMAFPVAISATAGGTGVQYYRGLGGLLATLAGRPVFLLSGDTLFSNVSGPLDYVSYDITEADFTPDFEEVVVLNLLAVIAYPITKDRKLAERFAVDAAQAMNMAITNNLNAGNPTYGNRPTEVEMARGAGIGLPWDWFPGRFG